MDERCLKQVFDEDFLQNTAKVNAVVDILWSNNINFESWKSDLQEICQCLIAKSKQLNELQPALSLLKVLGALLYGRCGLFEQYHSSIVGEGSVTEIYCSTRWDISVRLAAVQCIRNCALKSPGTRLSSHLQNWCFQVFIGFLQDPEIITCDSFYFAKIISAALRGCIFLLASGFKMQADDLPKVLGAIKTYMPFGLPGCSLVVPCILNVNETGSRKTTGETLKNTIPLKKCRKAKKSKRTRLAEKLERNPSSSSADDFSAAGSTEEESSEKTSSISEKLEKSLIIDGQCGRSGAAVHYSSASDYSDNEIADNKPKVNIRLYAFSLLASIAKNQGKMSLHGYWLHFFPDPLPSYYSSAGGLGVPAVLLKEPNGKVRRCALISVNEWTRVCRPLLMSAEMHNERLSSFTSLSQVLAGSVSDLHRILLLLFSAERLSVTKTQILKSLAYLIAATPYHKLGSDLIVKVTNQVKAYIAHRDSNVRVACLSCLGLILQSAADREKIFELLVEDKNTAWLWLHCEEILKGSNVANTLPVKLEALQTAAILFRVFQGSLSNECGQRAFDLTVEISLCVDDDIKLHSMRFLKQILIGLKPSDDNDVIVGKCWYSVVQATPVAEFIKSPSSVPSNLLLEICDIFGLVPESVLQKLDSSVAESIKSKLISYTNSQEIKVQLAVTVCLLKLCCSLFATEEHNRILQIIKQQLGGSSVLCREKILWNIVYLLERRYDCCTCCFTVCLETISEQVSKGPERILCPSFRILAVLLDNIITIRQQTEQEWRKCLSCLLSEFVTTSTSLRFGLHICHCLRAVFQSKPGSVVVSEVDLLELSERLASFLRSASEAENHNASSHRIFQDGLR